MLSYFQKLSYLSSDPLEVMLTAGNKDSKRAEVEEANKVEESRF